MDYNQLVELAGLSVLLILSGFFSGSETALLSLDRLRLTYLVAKKRPGARHLESLLNPPDQLITAILIGNNLVNIAASVFATTFFVRLYGPHGDVLTILVLTPLILIFAEILPKVFAANNSEKVAFLVLRPIRLVMFLLAPLVFLISGLSRLLRRFLGRQGDTPIISEEEIRTLIVLGEKSGVVAKEKRRMLHGIFELSKTRARDVMIPRTDVVGIEISTPFDEVLRIIRQDEHSRYPVFEETLDNILGTIHAKDIFPFVDNKEGFSLRRILREPYFVPESKRIEKLLQSFRERHYHLAVVVDEYGGMEGIVTLEDIFEEIVGEIQDEYDLEEELLFRELGPGRFLIDGSAPIHTVNRRFNLHLSEKHVNTLAGFILYTMGTIPGEGDVCTFEGTTFKVVRIADRRIEEIEMILPEKE
jgi:putative hemolysin